jgi:hypothetical protein
MAVLMTALMPGDVTVLMAVLLGVLWLSDG